MTNLSKLVEQENKLEFLKSHYEGLVECINQLKIDSELYKDEGYHYGVQRTWEYMIGMEKQARTMLDNIKRAARETNSTQ